jgi:hypothetical protein
MRNAAKLLKPGEVYPTAPVVLLANVKPPFRP